MSFPLLLATLWCLSIACLHTFVGSRTVVRPLMASDMAEPAKSTVYYCWHIVTIVLFAMTGFFGVSTLAGASPMPAMIATAGAAAFALWGLVLAPIQGQSIVTKMPQGLLFVVLTALGLWGVW